MIHSNTSRFRTALVTAGLLLVAGTTLAQEFGSQGQLAVSAERLMGFTYTAETQDGPGNATTTNSVTRLSLLVNPTDTTGTLINYSHPRIGIDYFVIPHLSVGGSLGFFHWSPTTTVENGGRTTETDGIAVSGFLFSPRVGYAHMFSPSFGIWPRGGITYVSAGWETDFGGTTTEVSTSRMALTLEVPLVITPMPHVAFTVAPTLDLGIAGSNESRTGSTTTSNDVTTTDIGLHAGLTVWF